ncbi:MAG: leucine-rich repeat protein [Lachnospiraceae bacterium]
MKRLNRVISMLLAAAMIFSCVPQMRVSANEDLASAQAAFEFSTLTGTIQDPDGNGVGGVSVLLYNIEENEALTLCTTDDSGRWTTAEYDIIGGYHYLVRYYKQGYEFERNRMECMASGSETMLDPVTAEKITSEEPVCNPSDYEYTIADEQAVITKYNGSDTVLRTPSEFGGCPVTEIGRGAFENHATIETVYIGEAVTLLDIGSFRNCKSLKNVYFPEGLTEIGSHAFYQSSCLENIVFPNSLNSLGAYAFYESTGLKSTDFPDVLESIGGNAFEGCTSLEYFMYPRGLQSAGTGIFRDCPNLTSIAVTEGVTALPDRMFACAESLEEVVLPDSLRVIGADVFDRCSGLKEIHLPEGLETIGTGAFDNCTGLTAVKLPDSVTTIQGYAFADCSNLESINHPLNWKIAGAGGIFSGCGKLKTVEIPEGVTAVPGYAFYNAGSLEYIHLPETLSSIGNNAFYGCLSLTEIVLPEGVTKLGVNAFGNCTGLVSVKLPDSLLTTGDSVFKGCSNLESLNYPKNWKTAGRNIIQGCSKLKHMTIPEGVSGIPQNAFYGSDQLERIYIPESVSGIGSMTFDQCPKLSIHGVSGSYAETYAKAKDIPFYAEGVSADFASMTGLITDESGNGVSGVAVSVYDRTGAESVSNALLTDENGEWSLPQVRIGHEYQIYYYKSGYRFSVNEIICTVQSGGTAAETSVIRAAGENDPVCDIDSYTYIILNNEAVVQSYTGTDPVILIPSMLGGYPVTTIGNSAFKDCRILKEVSFSEWVTTIEAIAFKGCTNLEVFNYPENWTVAYLKIFEGCSNLTEVTIPEGIKKIPEDAFSGAQYLQQIYFSSTLKEIGGGAFYQCTALSDPEFPDGLEKIGYSAFGGCTGLTSISFPDSLTEIGSNAFAKCINLRSIQYPINWTKADSGIFNGCSSLKEIVIPEGVAGIPAKAFSGADCLEKVQLPSGLKEIGNEGFKSCSRLSGIDLPEGLERIGGYAFQECTSISMVDFPESVTEIGLWAFYGCGNLKHIVYPINWKTAGNSIFKGCVNLTGITVPEGVTEIPKAAFFEADGLKWVNLPVSLISLGENSFRGCSSLKTMVLPEQVTSIGAYAFKNCTGLERIWIGSTVTEIPKEAFAGCTALTIHGDIGSYAEIYADENQIPFEAGGIASDHVMLTGCVLDEAGNGFGGVSVSLFDITQEKAIDALCVTAEDGSWSISDAIAGHTYQVRYYKEGYEFSENNLTCTAQMAGSSFADVRIRKAEVDIPASSDYSYSVSNGNAIITRYNGAGTKLHVPSELDGYPVTQIRDYAFQNCDTIEEISLPNGLQVIGSYAFYGCKNLRIAEFPDSVTMIKLRAFSGCMNLETFHYSRGLKNAEAYIFAGCKKLTDIVIPEGVTNVADQAFMYADCLQTVTLPSTIRTIGISAFRGCENLSGVNLPKGLQVIGTSAFLGCTQLTEMTFPESLRNIEGHAFHGCSGFTSLKLPDGVEKIGVYAFAECINLESINYPTGWSDAEGRTFQGCVKLKNMDVPEGVVSIADHALDGSDYLESVTLPSTLEHIGNRSFNDCIRLKNIVLPESLLTIGDYGFADCPLLKDMDFPEGMESLGAYAFSGCTGFVNVKLPDSVMTVQKGAFSDCSDIVSFDYPVCWTEAGMNIFAGCPKLRSVTVPVGVERVPAYAFYGAEGLRVIYLPETLREIGEFAFANCGELRTVTIPGNAELIGEKAFFGCTRLEEVYITGIYCELSEKVFGDSPEVLIYCKEFSKAALYMVENNLNFKLLSSDPDEYPHTLVREEDSYFYSSASEAQIEDRITMSVKYSIPADVFEKVTKPRLVVTFTQNLELLDDSVTLNGEPVQTYSYRNQVFSVSLTGAEGEIRFSVTPVEAGIMAVHARFTYTEDQESRTDVLGMVYLDQPVLKLNIPSRISTRTFEVTGVAAGEETVLLSVDGKPAGKVKTKKDGTFATVLSLPEDAVYGKVYAVTAVLESDDTICTEAEISYKEDAPVLTLFDMYYGSDYSRKLDLVNAEGTRLTNVIYPGSPFKFHIQLKNADSIADVYVVSKKDGVVSRMKAEPTQTPGEYIAEGYFEGTKTTYVPGTINIYYTTDASVEDYGQPIDTQMLPDAWKNASSDILQNSKDDYQAQITLSGGEKILFEYRRNLSADQMQGILASAGSQKSDISEDDGEVLTAVVLDQKMNRVQYVLKDQENNSFDVISIGTGESLSVCDICTDLADSDTETAWSLMNGENVSAVRTFTHMIALNETAADVACSTDLSSEEKASAVGMIEKLQWGYGSLHLLRFAAAVTEYDQNEQYQRFAEKSANVILGLAEELAENYLYRSLSYFAVGGRGTYLRWLIDPSGYVYDTGTEERLKGVTVTAYWIPYDGENTEFWNEVPAEDVYGEFWNAEEYSQTNPLITEADGCYAWDVPEGWWRVQFEKDGYETIWSEWMRVPPVQTDINIGMTLSEKQEFSDVPKDAYYYAPVLWALKNQVTSGYTEELFAPEMACTRGQVVTFLWRAKGCQEQVSDQTGFTDVPKEAYYSQAVMWAVENGITDGWTEDTFAPDRTVSRGQFVTFLYRAEKEPEYTCGSDRRFTDILSGTYYYDAVYWAVENGITDGWTQDTFAPEMPCTRGQVVTFLYRAYN